MKNILLIFLSSLFILSCSENENKLYVYDQSREVSKTILTKNETGGIIEIDNVSSIENGLGGITAFEFISMASGYNPFKNITLNSDTDITIEVNNPNEAFDVFTVSNTNEQQDVLGLTIEEEIITQKVCHDLTIGTFIPFSLNSNFCTDNDGETTAYELFSSLNFQTNDTLAYSVIEYIYTRRN